jgi:sec-independent protein translocase protein TatC
MRKKNKDKNKDLTVVGHLEELRKRVIYSGFLFIIAAFISYRFGELIVEDILSRAPDMNFVYISPPELMLSYIKLAIVSGLVVAAPFILSQIWMFISPGFDKKEKRYLIISLILGGGFFVLGVVFSYTIVMPIILKFFAGFQTPLIKPMISFNNHLSFVINILLSFGVVFELPVMMLLLTRFGLLNPSMFVKYRKYMILIIFVLAAVLTPPDIISQSLLAVPMLALFELGILLSRIAQKKKNK